MKKTLYTLALALAFHLEGVAATVTGSVSFVTKRGQNPNRAETLVWLDPVAPAKSARAETVQMITRSKTLVPHVLAVPVGSTVQFPNEDPIIHNIFSVSPTNPFDLGLYKRNSGKSETFEKPGVVNVYCNVHPNMSAVIHVMSTPYYTFANAAGAFSLTDVAPGKYRLAAWNEIAGVQQSQIEVLPNGQTRGSVTLTLDARNHRATPHLNKHNQPYKRSRSNDY